MSGTPDVPRNQGQEGAGDTNWLVGHPGYGSAGPHPLQLPGGTPEGVVVVSWRIGSRVLRSPSLASGTMPSSLHMSSYTWTLSKGSTSRPFLKLGPTARKMVFMSMTSLSKPCSPLLNCTFTLCQEGGLFHFFLDSTIRDVIEYFSFPDLLHLRHSPGPSMLLSMALFHDF